MDAFVQLALIEKAKQVFATDAGALLSFPLLSPVSFTAEELAALAAPASAADYALAADFARIVNFIPRDLVASASDRMLWDVYLDVLQRAEVPPDAGAAAPVADTAFLYQTAPDGSRTESEALRRYRQYRDAWFVAREDYATHKLTGELSEDPEVRRKWTDEDEPRLRAAVDEAARQWESQGQRGMVEAALKAERASAMRTPGLRWAEWSGAFNPDIDLISDAGGARYAPTGLSPRNFAEQEEWLEFELTAGEMRALVDAAPAALKAVLDGSGGSDIEKVAFQYRSVGVVRSWFRPEALTSRIWRSSDQALLLNDGGDPPRGECPAYVSACVFVRDIVETKKAATSGGATTDHRIDRFDLAINPRHIVQRELRVDPAILSTIARRHQVVPLPPPPPLDTMQLRGFRALERNNFSVAAALRGSESVATPTLRRRLRLPLMIDRFGARALLTPSLLPAEPPSPPLPPPPEPPPREEISILAFICKRLPKAPDPAPELAWL